MQHFKLKQTLKNTRSKAGVLTGFFILSLIHNSKMKKAVAQNQNYSSSLLTGIMFSVLSPVKLAHR